MISLSRIARPLAGVTILAATLAACTTARTPPNQGLPQVPPPPVVQQTIAPVPTGSVSTSDLPLLPGTTTTAETTGGGTSTVGFEQPALPPTGTGRNLSGPLSIDMLLGGWTARAGANDCRLNLTYTARGATGRYRASAPGCADSTLGGVASWQLLGTQIQLYDASDALIGTMAQSGNGFIGTLSGGTPIAMNG